MEKSKIEQQIIKKIKESKNKNITLSEIYQVIETPYIPEIQKEISGILEKLIKDKTIEPLKTSEKDIRGNYIKYRILIKEDYQELKEEIVKTLVKPINLQYYLKHPKEYQESKEIINKINNFLKQESKSEILTVNERSYQLFKDEKLLKKSENILKKLGITYENLNSYETYEPFFYYENFNAKGKEKKILIIENKDTFWTMKKVAEESGKIFLVIYGEGKKILNSFPYIKNFDLSGREEILYFGDIDFEGINIYISLKEKYPKYNILPYLDGYKKMLELEPNPKSIRTSQNEKEENNQKFIEFFEKEYQEKLKYIFKNKKYIPQEIINYYQLIL